MDDEARIGRRIREIRLSRKCTLQALADVTGLTKGYLSKVENSGKAAPVSTLFRIAKALEVPPADLIDAPGDTTSISVVRRGAGEMVAMGRTDVGYSYQSLSSGMADKQMLAYLLTVPVREEGVALTEYEHDGQELLYVVEGTLGLHHDGSDHTLAEGDSALFDATRTHSVEAYGGKPAKAVMVASAISGAVRPPFVGARADSLEDSDAPL